ncbi:MAG: phosphate ABC transporter permease PstA, partial [Halobacteria archaeon]|nr:phosphate ABC transporter permease PstA [Halobacteria archaeon]
TLGLGNLALVVALVAGGGFATLGLFTREDIGATLPAGAFLVFAGAVFAVGVIAEGWVWNPENLGAEFPAHIVVPFVTMNATLIATWTAAKANGNFGARGRQRGAYLLITSVAFGMLSVLAILVLFVTERGLTPVLENAVVGAPGIAVFSGGILGIWAFRRYRSDSETVPSPEMGNVPKLATIAFLGIAFVVSAVVSVTGMTVEIAGLSLVSSPTIDWPFLMNPSQGLGIQRGVMPAILGTVWLVVGAVSFAVPLAVGAAVYLTEYAEEGWFTNGVQVAVNGLWSTPSIVFGLFGLAFLVPRFGNTKSIFAGQLVLGFMLLPLVLITSHEAMKSVPDEYRDASAALGATKWQTIRSVVIPASMPGIITGVILGVGRIAGETAPLLLVFGGSSFPTSGPNVLTNFEFSVSLSPPFVHVTNDALMEAASALPYQLYATITAGAIEEAQRFGWGTALVLLFVVLSFYAIGIASRTYFRRKLNA